MPAGFFVGDHGHVQLPNPVAHHGDGYKDAIYEDFPPYGPTYSDYSNTGYQSFAPSYSSQIDHLKQPTLSAFYNHPISFAVDDYYPDHPCLHPMGAPMMAPLHIEERVAHHHRPPQPHDFARIPGYTNLPEPTYSKEEKPMGGVSANLDYDMDQMTDFVAETTVTMYDLSIFSIPSPDVDILRSIRADHTVSSAFRKWVSQVLSATRLPSATILLSLSYLAIRVRQENAAGSFRPSERTFYKMIVVALILGSKFLDDNTFQNKSWAEVTNISVLELNCDERDWLAGFGHRLHYDPSRVDGFDSALEQWKSFQARAEINQRTLPTLQPIDTNLKRQHSMQTLSSNFQIPQGAKAEPCNYNLDPALVTRSYGTPSYPQYDPWYGNYRSIERSPLSSASQSGPQTPEYMNGPARGWGFSHQSRAPQYGYSAVTSFAPHSSTVSSGHRRHCDWTTHGAYCQCQMCRHQNPLIARFGSAVTA